MADLQTMHTCPRDLERKVTQDPGVRVDYPDIRVLTTCLTFLPDSHTLLLLTCCLLTCLYNTTDDEMYLNIYQEQLLRMIE